MYSIGKLLRVKGLEEKNFCVSTKGRAYSMLLLSLYLVFDCLVASAQVVQPVSPMYDFRSWSATTISNLQAVALANDDANITSDTPWSTSESATPGVTSETNDGHGFYNHAVVTDAALAANGTAVAEVAGLTVNAPSHGIGIINDIASTSLGDYANSSYLWLMNKTTYVVIPNVLCGATITVGVESHNPSKGRGVEAFYKDANGEWQSIGKYTSKVFANKTFDIPVVPGLTSTEVKLQATDGMHLYYIDAQINGMKVLTNSLNLTTGDTRTLVDGTDYENRSGAAITFSTGNADVATVDANGVITAVGVGETTITLSQPASGDYEASNQAIAVSVISTNVNPTFTTNLNATYSVLQGRTVCMKVDMIDGDTYQWYTCTDIDGETGKTAIENATSNTYNIPDEWPNGVYYVYCLATNSENGNYTRSNVATVTVSPITHTFDFTSLSAQTLANMAADNVNWTPYENGTQTAGANDDIGYYTANAMTDFELLSANGVNLSETYPLLFAAKGKNRAFGFMYDMPTAAISGATQFYNGSGMLWLTSKGNSSIVIPNVKCGSTLKIGLESHKNTEGRGVTLYYGSNNSNTWTKGDAYKPMLFTEYEITVPGTDEVTDLKLEATNGTHIYYLDVDMQGFRLLSDTKLMEQGEEYTLVENTDYAKLGSDAVVKAISSSDETVATVDENGKITAVGTGTAVISVKQEKEGVYSETILELTLNVKKLYTVTYGKGSDSAVKGQALGAVRYEENAEIKLPSPNRLMYKDGFTMTGWNDGQNTYAFADDYTVTRNVNMVPVFTANTTGKTLSALANAETVTWQFGRTNGAPLMDWNAASAQPGYLVAQCNVNGETQDVALKINTQAEGAGFTNAERADKADAQVGDHTVFTIPAAEHMQITINNVSGAAPAATISATGLEATEMTWNSSAKTLTYTYDGNASEVIIDVAAVEFLDGITVKYPRPSDFAIVENTGTLDMTESEKHTLTIDADYVTSSDGAMTYTSSNDEVATVTASGEIVARGAGTAVITVKQAATSDCCKGEINFTVNVTATTQNVVITNNLPATAEGYIKSTNIFSIAADNASHYQWYVCTNANKSGSTAIAGATEPEYNFRPAIVGVHYIYCVASNSKNSVASVVCKVTANRKLQWTFAQTAEEAAAIQTTMDGGSDYWGTSSNGRYVTNHIYTGEEVMIDENTPLPIMEGLLVTGSSSNQLLVGSPTNTNYNRLQLNAEYTITIPGCKGGDEINIVCEQASNKTSVTRELHVSNAYCADGLGDNHDYIQNTEHQSTFKFVMQRDGDCNITAENYAIYSISIIDENYVKKRYVYSVVAVDSLSGDTLDYVLPVTTAWEGDVVSGVAYSYWKRTADNRLVQRSSQNKNFHMNYEVNQDTTFVIRYKNLGIDKVVYLSEAENISGAKPCAGSTVEARASNAGAAYCDAARGIKLTTLSPGRYAIRVGILDAKKGGENKLALLADKDSIKFVTPATSSTNQFCELADTITVDGFTDIIWPKGGDDDLGFDIIAIYDVSLPKADKPVIELDNETATMTITTGDDEDDVYYTIDGTTPSSTNGTYYDGTPVHLPTNCSIRAVALHSQKKPSDIADKITEFVTYKVNVTPWPRTFGFVQVTPQSGNNTYTVGTEVTVRAVAKAGYGFKGWCATTDGSIEDGMEDQKHTFTMTAEDVVLYAQFAEGVKGTVHYDLSAAKWYTSEGEEAAPQTINGASTFPTEIVSTSVIVPSNYSLYVPDYTLAYWEDSENRKYECGVNKLFTNDFKEVTLHPVYQNNAEADILSVRTTPVEITWDFRTAYGAQPVTMEKGTGEERYYTTHATVSGQTAAEQIVDVPVVIAVGTEEGSFTNEDMDTWSYMTPGTKVIVPSGAGARFTLATYARISDTESGTRINGKLPDNIYSEELVKNADGHYLYTWLVDEETPTAQLIIGADDYAYYAYLKAELKAAALKTLNVTSENSAKGTVKIVTTGDVKVSGGHAFTNGTYVTVAAARNRFYELDYWLDGNGNKIYPDNHWVDADNQSHNTELSSPFSIDNITYTRVDQDTIKFQLGQNLDLQAVFKDKKSYYIDFSAGGQAEGLPPLQQHVEEGEAFTMPLHNNRLYLEGYTLVDYTDASGNHYKFANSYVPTSDLHLTPNFKRNNRSLGDVTEATTLTWPLTTAGNAADLYYNKSQGLTVNQLKFVGDSIDVPLYIDGSAGALSNQDNSAYCVISAGCVLTMPTSKNCVININSINGVFQNTVIAGATSLRNTAYSLAYGATASPMVTYTGEAASQDILMKESRRCTDVSVTYMPIDRPELSKVTYGSTDLTAAQLATLKSAGEIGGISCAASYDAETLTTVSATVTNGSVEIAQPTAANPVAQITLKTAGGVVADVYTISFVVTDKTAPTAQSATVSGNAASLNGSTTVSGVGENGVIAITFDHYMNDVTLASTTGLGQALVGKADGKTLKFTYWNLIAGQTYTLTIPAQTLSDTYGTSVAGSIVVKFTPEEKSNPQPKLFDFVVTHKRSWDCETQTEGELVQTVSNDVIANLDKLNIRYGTIDEATEAANAASGSERFYIFVPDGEYCMKGNSKGVLTGTYNDTKLGNNQGLVVENYYNGRTFINRDNVSIIGQSQNRTVLYNEPYIYGISYTSTIEVRSKKKDCYFQDFTVDNRFSKYQVDRGDANPTGQAVAVYDRGIHSVWKNVSMKGYQDTYASAANSSGFNVEKGQVTPNCFHTYRYYEDCQVWGTVDFLCGGGDDWWERPTFVLRKRATANNIVAPRHFHPSVTQYCTGADYLFTEKWGYVFNNAKVKAESEAAYSVQNGKFTLGRPWAYSPTCTFLNTDFSVKPADVGWSNMSGTLVIRMHEYGSTLNGLQMDLTKRTLRASTPAAGSDDCILTAEQAAQYTMHNVLGGDDAYDPTIYTKQISMEDAIVKNSTNDNGDCTITWNPVDDALCYFIFRIDEATGDTLLYTLSTGASFKPADNQAGKRFVIRAANERGGLGAPSRAIVYMPLESFSVTVKEVGAVSGKGWSTVCLPVDATFTQSSDITVYAAVSVDNTTLTLKKVTTQGLKAGRGYIIYATAPDTYIFKGTYNAVTPIYGNIYSVLDGNPENHAVSVGMLNIYTLAYKSEISSQVGFYKFVGSQIPARKAYLTSDYLASQGFSLNDAGAKGLNVVFLDDDEDIDGDATDVQGVNEDADGDDETVYDLSGKAVERSQMHKGQIYIVNGEKKMW